MDNKSDGWRQDKIAEEKCYKENKTKETVMVDSDGWGLEGSGQARVCEDQEDPSKAAGTGVAKVLSKNEVYLLWRQSKHRSMASKGDGHMTWGRRGQVGNQSEPGHTGQDRHLRLYSVFN